ncbi:MAG: hypothetical protein ACJ751_17310 [Niastella sp.]|jgi:hypothetical protein|uniref:hypothetical protein n=1 Tax=Niastella sp. TaxID=1869183 RepID=UPI00389A264D
MKKTYSILMITIMVTAFVACKKDKNNNDPKNDLKSTWELAEYGTSWMPNQTYEPGNGNLLRFNDDTFIKYDKDKVLEQGKYTTAPDNTVEESVCETNLKDTYTRRIDFTYDDSTRVYFKTFYYIADNKLYLISGCNVNDGRVKAVYRRANPIPID